MSREPGPGRLYRNGRLVSGRAADLDEHGRLTGAAAHDESGVDGNARLTGAVGALLFVLLFVEGVTILRIRQLIGVHVFVGLLLVPPVLLKTGSTVYRFYRYYTGSGPYVRKGPPHPLLRLAGPFVILLTLILFGSGSGCSPCHPSGRDCCSRRTRLRSCCGSSR